MEILTRFNPLDLMIVLAMGGGFFMGWHRGVIRQLMSLVAFYVALVVGAQFYRTVSGWLMSISPASSWVMVDTIAFALVFIIVLVIFNMVGYLVYKDTRIALLRAADNLLGGVLGVATIILELVIALSLARFASSTNWLQFESMRQFLVDLLGTSVLDNLFLTAAPILYEVVRPWLPAGLPALFTF